MLPSAAPLALLAAHGTFRAVPSALRAWSRALRVGHVAAFTFVLALAVSLTGLDVVTRGTENFRGAVAALLARHEAGDPIISVEWQPPLFPQGQPFDDYAPGVRADPPPRLAYREYTLVEPRDLEGQARALMLRKSLPDDQHLMQLMRRDFELVEVLSFGWALDVVVWHRR